MNIKNENDSDYCKKCGTPLLFPDKPCPKCKSYQDIKEADNFENNQVNYNENMFLNFSFSKAYNDLVSNKNYIWELFGIALVFFILNLMQIWFKSNSISIYASVMLSGYMCVMANNILQGKEPVLADIYNLKDKRKNMYYSGAKQSGVQLIYFAILGILGYFIVMFLGSNYGIKPLDGSFLVAFIFLPLIVFLLISAFILFSENLSFKESFNLIKSARSFKYAWKGYLFSGALYILSLVGAVVIFSILYRISTNIVFTQILYLFMYSFMVISNYFCSHFIAQSYKYALSKMN